MVITLLKHGINGGEGDLELGLEVPDGSHCPLDGKWLSTVGVLAPQLRLTSGSPYDSGRAGMAPAKLHRRRLARRRRHSRRQLSLYKIAMMNATICLLVIFCKSVFSNQMSKALVLNFRTLHFFPELP